MTEQEQYYLPCDTTNVKKVNVGSIVQPVTKLMAGEYLLQSWYFPQRVYQLQSLYQLQIMNQLKVFIGLKPGTIL